jgi:hypothetical protein
MKESEMPEVGWVAESEIDAKMRKAIRKSEIQSKKELAGARAKSITKLLQKQLKFN